jgi:hypothetical protein
MYMRKNVSSSLAMPFDFFFPIVFLPGNLHVKQIQRSKEEKMVVFRFYLALSNSSDSLP